MVNRVVLVGRLTKAIDLKKSDSGTAFAVFTIAADNRTKDSNGERGTMFLDCRIFGNQAENMFKNTRKGSRIAVDGSLNQRNFTRKDGSNGHAIEVIVDSVTFLDPLPGKEAGEEAPEIEEPQFNDEPNVSSEDNDIVDNNDFSDNDLPF